MRRSFSTGAPFLSRAVKIRLVGAAGSILIILPSTPGIE